MDCSTLVQKTLPTPETVRAWAQPFENTGIDYLHLCHIVAGQAAAYAALHAIADSSLNLLYRPSVEQVEQWMAQVTISLSREQLLQYVAQQSVSWVVSQVCPIYP